MTSQPLTNLLKEAVAHHNAQRFARAEAIYRQAAVGSPGDALIYFLWGQAVEQQGRFVDALRCYTRATQLAPHYVQAVTRQAAVLIALGRTPEAEGVAKKLVEVVPQNARAWITLGNILKVRGRLVEALACHQNAVSIDAAFPDGWCHLGLTMGVMGRNHEALQAFEHALELNPRDVAARFGRAQALHKVYRIQEAVADYDSVLESAPQHPEAPSCRLFALQNLPGLSREDLFAEHVEYGRSLGHGRRAMRPRDGAAGRPLRLAILSPDFRSHSCAYFLEPLLRHLDPAAFELYLYHDHFVEDAVTERFRRMARQWRRVVAQPAAVVEQVIRTDAPDLLMDLTGHVGGGTIRLPLFAKRLAPVQITYLGYPDTTGVPNMDIRLTDAIADPIGEADAFATERLVRFSECAWAYQPMDDAPAVALPPSSRDAAVTFGCFNSPTKYNSELFRAWSRLLQRVPGSRLLLKGRDFTTPPVREDFLRRLADAGIARDRIELLPCVPTTAGHLAAYARVDIALDTFPYNGTTTTCEALWMGRPVVTLRGDRHAARVGSSLLTAAGCERWIAGNQREYVEIAAALAADRSGLVRVAASLRDTMRQSVLLDHVRQSARFAEALRMAWSGQSRQTAEVSAFDGITAAA